jgi:hypothetical protein
MARTAQISKEKQQSITLRHEGQSMQKIKELLTFLKVQSQKPSRATMKLALMRTVTGMEDRVTAAAEDKFISYKPQKLQPQINY